MTEKYVTTTQCQLLLKKQKKRQRPEPWCVKSLPARIHFLRSFTEQNNTLYSLSLDPAHRLVYHILRSSDDDDWSKPWDYCTWWIPDSSCYHSIPCSKTLALTYGIILSTIPLLYFSSSCFFFLGKSELGASLFQVWRWSQRKLVLGNLSSTGVFWSSSQVNYFWKTSLLL